MSSLTLFLCLVFLTGVSVFFSVNAIALRIFSYAKLHEAFKDKNRENQTEKLVKNADRLTFACCFYLLGLNSAIVLLVFAFFETIGQGGFIISSYVLTFIIASAIFLVFSLAIPNAWAKYAGEKILSRTYELLFFLAVIISPILSLLELLDTLIRRLAGVPESIREDVEEKQEEFLNGLEQQRIEGVVDQEEQEMIENVLELSDTTAAEIMTPRTDIIAVEADCALQRILEIVNKAGHSRLPVYEENIDNIIGFIYAKDLLTEIGKTSEDFELREKIRKAYFVPETKPLRALLHEFQNQKLHIAVVLDEYGGTAGIVSLEDILEELVGEIADEYEEKPPEPIKIIDENTIELDARTYIDDVNDQFEANLPDDEDYDTVGGFVFSHLGYIPKTGKKFDYENLTFTIIAAETRRIKHIRIRKTSQQKKC